MSTKQVQTVLGPVPVSELGKTLMHEHILVSFPGAELDPRYLFDRKAFVDIATAKLKALREWGVETFVDPCPIEMGRDVRLMAEISERSGMNIICTTGFYFEGMGLPSYWRHASVDEISALYVRDIERGIDGTAIRAGLIKCATSASITPLEQKVLAAASLAQRATGVPIITHTEDGLCGPEQQDLFEQHGVPLRHCLIGHSCGNPDHAYHRRIVQRDSYIGFDRIGLIRRQSDEVRADNVVKLVDAGFGRQVMLSQDGYCGWRGKFFFEPSPERSAEIDARRASGEWPTPQTYIFTHFLPKLRERGISDEQIDVFLTENPRAYFLQDG
jgi:phosphotriesterase-related protein